MKEEATITAAPESQREGTNNYYSSQIMKYDFISKRINQYYKWNNAKNFQSPTIELENLMLEISDSLARYMKNNPNVKQGYVAKQQDIISRMFDIVEQLKECEPLDVWVRMNEDIRRASAIGSADYLKILLPLRPGIKKFDLNDQPVPTQVIIDYVWPGQLSDLDYKLI